MKVIVSESKLGIEYLADVISSCNQNGIECIVDDNAGEILYYLPKEGRYGDDKLLQNSDESIFDLVKDKEQLVKVLRDAKGDEFKKFAVKWNGLQTKGEDEEVYKTDHCNPIRGNFSEGIDNPNDWSASALAEELGVDAKRDVVEKEDGEYDYFSPEHTFGVKLPDGSDATYLVYDNEESATTSAADDLGEHFQDAPEILAAAIDYFGFQTFAKYINGVDEDELADIEQLNNELGKEEFASYVVNNLGVDYRGFAEFNIEELGPAWHLAEYDGKELELPNGMVAYRVD